MTHSYATKLILLASAFSGSAACAQLPVVDISLENDLSNHQLLLHLRANDYDFGELLSNLVFTVRWPETSTATLSFGTSEWCPAPSSAFNPAPSAMVTPGNGFKYRSWNSIGLALLSEIQDDGGCDQTLFADTWTHVLTIPVSNDPNGTFFEIADDQFTADNNRGFFVSLNGEQYTGTGTPPTEITGEIYSFTTDVSAVNAHAGLVLSPNPADNTTSIAWPGSGPWSVAVFDATGRMVKQQRMSGPTGVLATHDLAAGSYELRALEGRVVRSATLIVVR